MRQKSLANNIRVAICAIFKNEKPYILEWLSHHGLIGITDFYIADNISTDGSSELLESLHHDGIITRLAWPTLPGTKPQLPAYEKLAELARNDGVDWALFIDADEFISLDEDLHSIQSAIMKILQYDNNIAGVTINWATYGSSRLIINSESDVLCNFEFRFKKDSNINRHYKSMIKLDSFVSSGNTPHEFKIISTSKYVNTAGQAHIPPLSGLSNTVTWENIKINHYMIKSRAEYVSKKMKKGRASSNTNLDMTYFHAHDVNDEYAPMSRSWVGAVQHHKKELQDKYSPDNHGHGHGQLYYHANKQHIGNIDSIRKLNERTLVVNGWAIGKEGIAPSYFRVILDDHVELIIKEIKIKSRPDVLNKIGICSDDNCGFTILCDVPHDHIINSISIYHGDNYVISTGMINTTLIDPVL